MTLNNDIAQDLLDIKAVQIKTKGHFTWTSGIKSPIYCDNRLTMSYPEIRNRIVEGFVKEIEQMKEKPDIIAGCATAGIPHAAWLASELNLPMVYVRSSPKGHGKGNQIEGYLEHGKKVILIEDLISTGGSVISAAKALEEEGVKVLEILAIFTYGLEKAKENFAAASLTYRTLTNFDYLVNVFGENESLSDTEKDKLIYWRDKV